MEALRSFGWNRFPPTYDQQWTMIDDIMNSGGAPPAAVYVDFVYTGQGGPNEGFETFAAGVAAATRAARWSGAASCQAEPLVKIACILAAGGTPIVFAKPSPTDVPTFTDVQKRLDGVAVLAPALVGSPPIPWWSLRSAAHGGGAGRGARLRCFPRHGHVRRLVPPARRRLRGDADGRAEGAGAGGPGRGGRRGGPGRGRDQFWGPAGRGVGLASGSGLSGDDPPTSPARPARAAAEGHSAGAPDSSNS